MNFLETLVKKGIINRYQVDEIIEATTKEDKTIEQVLDEMGVSDDAILEAKSEYFGIKKKNINYDKVDEAVVKKIPIDSAKTYQMVAFNMTDDGVLEVGMLDPRNIEAQNVLQFITAEHGTPYEIYIITERGYQELMKKYSGLTGEVGDVIDDYIDIDAAGKDLRNDDDDDGDGKENGDGKITEDAPVTKMVAAIIRHAVKQGASDIHIEHTGEVVRVRFRIDGVLNTYLEIPKQIHSAMVSRVKIMTKTMKLDERRKPQDGRFPAMIEGRKIDFRVSVMPTFFGEKVVIRILDPNRGIRRLDLLGISDSYNNLIREAIARPHGLILITGPTGSGKTTTLYAMLNEVDRETKNVVSLEDPVEYQLPGVNQSQVHAEIGYTFASGLRSIVRQDPDIIMVGEIRDKETANLAIQAALTGHLVFATLHTNSSFGIIPRLVDMGVDPYLIAPTLILGIAQRLVRTIADGAAVPFEKEASVKQMIQKQFADLPEEYKSKLNLDRNLYDVKPTKEAPDGLKGRMAVFEMFKVDKEMEAIILEEPTEERIYKAARRHGMITLKETAILEGLEGRIPFSEINQL
ncbi:Flp pilus assembly complex ATPase component TadA [Patescibacteria group bacterium]|nr:Flp pilus assembly complex ATPase component TadA [Patescibacteria group bacterium]